MIACSISGRLRFGTAVVGIVINLDQAELQLSLRKLPMIIGGSQTTLTETVTIPVPTAS